MHQNLEKKFCAIGPRSICSGACAIIFTNCQTYVYDPVTMTCYIGMISTSATTIVETFESQLFTRYSDVGQLNTLVIKSSPFPRMQP